MPTDEKLQQRIEVLEAAIAGGIAYYDAQPFGMQADRYWEPWVAGMKLLLVGKHTADLPGLLAAYQRLQGERNALQAEVARLRQPAYEVCGVCGLLSDEPVRCAVAGCTLALAVYPGGEGKGC